MIRHRVVRLLGLSIAVAALSVASAKAQTPRPERLLLTNAAPTVPAFDTLYNVRAITYTAQMLPDTSARIAWAVHQNPGAVSVVKTDLLGHRVNLAANTPGVAFVVATWQRGNTVVYKDSIRVNVQPPRVVSLVSFSDVRNGRLIQNDTIRCTTNLAGQCLDSQTFCAYSAAYDRHGGLQTGRSPVKVKASNLTVVSYDGPGPLCPDTTVNPSLVHPLNHRDS